MKKADIAAANALYSAFTKDFSAGKFAPIIVFHGEEDYLKTVYKNQLIKALVPEGLEDFNLFVFENGRFSKGDVISAVEGLPVMAERKLIVFEDPDLKDKELEEFLQEAFKNPPAHAVLLFIFKTAEFKKTYFKAAKSAALVPFLRQPTGSLVPWIIKHFAAQGKLIDRDAALHLIGLSGDLMNTLKTEIEKIASHASGDTITKTDIDALGSKMSDPYIFDLADAIERQDVQKALTLFSELADSPDGVYQVLFAQITRSIKQLYMAKISLEERVSAAEFARAVSLPAFVADKLRTAAGRIDKARLRSSVMACADCDYAAKTGAVDVKEAQLLRLLYTICKK